MTTNLSVRRVYWATQETVADWLPTAVNTAGSFDLATDGMIVCGRRTKSQTLIFTTTDLWSMNYIGGTFVYAFRQEGLNCGIISQRAVVVLDTGAFWMGFNKFLVFDGFVKTISCEVEDYVFGGGATSLNTAQSSLVWALANPQYNEVTWFYPSGSATVCDRYVTFNYLENHWVFGQLGRAAGVTQQAGTPTPVPVLIDALGNIYDHETGTARGGSAGVFLESGPVELSVGDQVMRVQRIVPDDKTLGNVSASLYTNLLPDNSETLNGPYTLAAQTSVRLTARQVRLRIQEAVASAWRVGVVRLGVVLGGRR